jgi:hypothetical protein
MPKEQEKNPAIIRLRRINPAINGRAKYYEEEDDVY